MGIPTPEPGLVISYAYLWHREHRAGLDEGRKDRPAVVVLALQHGGEAAIRVVALPITHTPPDDPLAAVEIPMAVKRHLGLDDARSWIMVDEGNIFFWPGYDLRKRPGSERYDYGYLPPRFFDTVRRAFVEWYRMGRMRTTPRS